MDLGGTHIGAALADERGTLLVERTIPTASHEGPEAVLGRIAGLVRALAAETGRHPQSLGMGVPGLVDLLTGTTRFLPNLPTQWRDVPASRILSGQVGCPVYLLNDARAAALGELTYGSGREAASLLFFTIGTGIGGGVVIDRRLRLGPLGAAGELGHQTIVPDGPMCGCGNRGCLEALASGPAMAAEGVRLLRTGLAPALHQITGGDAGRVTPETMAEAASRDRAVAAAIDRAAGFLGIGIANLVTALHPDLVVLGGGVAAMGERLLGPVRRAVADRVRMLPLDGVRIERSALGEKAGLYGAAALALRCGRLEQDS